MDLNGVIQALDSGSWLSLSVIKANAAKSMAGEIMHLGKCRLARKSMRSGTTKQTTHHSPLTNHGKNPHHSWNFTRNVELPNGSIRTIHPLFVFRLNNQPVV